LANRIVIILFLSLWVYKSNAQTPSEADTKKTRILFILDASGSMYDMWEGKTRMTIAKEVLSNMVDSLKNTPHLELALRVYGHEWNKRSQNCKDTKLEIPFSPGNHESIKKRITTITPGGTTLIAYSLEQSANDFPADINSRNIIILITDGIEVCGGDPCAVSLALQKRKVVLTPFIIGIGPDDNFEKELSCIGKYFDATDTASFKNNLSKILKQSLKDTKVKVDLLDISNNATETNVNMTFYNAITGEALYDFVHHINANGKSDYLKVDPLITYDIVVNTIPKVEKKGVILDVDKENVVAIKTPQGILSIKGSYPEYSNLQALIKEEGKSNILNVQSAGQKEKYLCGSYDIEILTLPRLNFKNVVITQSQATVISVPMPGLLNILDTPEGYGSIYEVKPNGEHNWIYNVSNSKGSITLQPGNYKFVFKIKKSIGSEFTDVQYFSIKSGATTTLKLFKK
jgi:Ca-activated chloride channel homolog